VFVSVKAAWIINHNIKLTKILFEFCRVIEGFTVLIIQANNKSVKIVVSPKVKGMCIGKSSNILV